MSNLADNVRGPLEDWEREEGRYISESVAGLSKARRLTILLSVGLVTAIEISNRLSINVLLPDMQGNVAASSDEISWVVILYNLGFLCSLALATWMTRVIGARKHLLLSIGLYAIGAIGCFLSAHSLESLLIARLIMGFGGGAFLVRTVILAGLMFPGAARTEAVPCLYGLLFIFQIIYPVCHGMDHRSVSLELRLPAGFSVPGVGDCTWSGSSSRGLLVPTQKRGSGGCRGRRVAHCFAGVLADCHQPGRTRSMVRITLDCSRRCLASSTCFIAFLWWDSRPENRAPFFICVWFGGRHHAHILFHCAYCGGDTWAPDCLLCHNISAPCRTTARPRPAVSFRCLPLGLGTGLLISLRILLPRLGGVAHDRLGLLMMIATFVSIAYIWTPTTPTVILDAGYFASGFLAGSCVAGSRQH